MITAYETEEARDLRKQIEVLYPLLEAAVVDYVSELNVAIENAGGQDEIVFDLSRDVAKAIVGVATVAIGSIEQLKRDAIDVIMK